MTNPNLVNPNKVDSNKVDSNLENSNIVEPKIAGTKSSLHTLRDGLAQAEKQILHLDRTNIEAFLLQLDQTEKMFADFAADQSAILAESGRWSGLLKRVTSQPKVLVAAAANVGGLPKLRSKHQPATGFWWHVDDEVKRHRTQTIKKGAMAIGSLVLIIGVLYFAVRYLAPGMDSASALADTTARVEQLVADQKWQEGLTLVQTARKTLPNDPELAVWEVVLFEQIGDTDRAQAGLAEAQRTLVGTTAAFWIRVGTDRQMAGNLEGAEQAAQRALTNAPEDPQVTFLLASIAEARGDLRQAEDYFNKTIQLASDSNVELGVIAKMRMGTLMQQVQPIPVPMPDQTITATETVKSP